MTEKELDKLIWLVGNGHNTYKELHQNFPYLSMQDFRSMSLSCLGGLEKYIGLEADKGKFQFLESLHYQFSDNDIFYLTEDGQNRFDKLQKEHQSELREKIILIFSLVSAIASIIALFKP